MICEFCNKNKSTAYFKKKRVCQDCFRKLKDNQKYIHQVPIKIKGGNK